MIIKLKYIPFLLLAVIFANGSAQNSQVMYNMNLPQNHMLNPALRPTNSFYIGLPVLSGTAVSINSNLFSFDDIFIKDPATDSIFTFLHPDYNIDDFLAKVKDKNYLEPSGSIQLLGVGFNVGQGSYVFIDINERFEGNIVIPGDLFELALKGNAGFAGSTIDLSSLRGDIKYYREAGVGFSKNFTNKLRIGVKGKLLFGVGAVSIDNRDLGIKVYDDYSHEINADLAVNISAPLLIEKDSDGNIENIEFDDSGFDTKSGLIDFFSGTKNMGFGIDIGATYDISNKFMVSASVTDLGYIKWKKDVTNLTAESQFLFSGLDMLDVINGTKTIEEVGEEMLDSLENSFTVSDTYDPFTTWLPTGVTFGGRYSLTKSLSLGLLSYTKVIEGQLRETVTFSGNVNLSTAFSAAASYSISNNRYDNLGLGLAARAGVFQLYVLADRIPLTWFKIENSPVPLPSKWNTLNIRLGLNLVFGNKINQREDKPMIVVE